VVRVAYEVIEVVPAAPAVPAPVYRLDVPGEVRAEGFGLVFTAELLDPGMPPAAAPSEALLDAARVQPPLLIRSWRAGDRFAPSGLGGRKKVQDFFVDAKVPRWRRSGIPLVTDGRDEILWVVGYRVSETCRVTERTNRVLRLRAGPA